MTPKVKVLEKQQYDLEITSDSLLKEKQQIRQKISELDHEKEVLRSAFGKSLECKTFVGRNQIEHFLCKAHLGNDIIKSSDYAHHKYF
jgi:hypothetical protein